MWKSVLYRPHKNHGSCIEEEIVTCPNCKKEMVLSKKEEKKLEKEKEIEIKCPHCKKLFDLIK